MSYTCQIVGESTGTSIDYGVNNYTAGKYLRQFDAGDVVADLQKFRVPGTDGSLIVRSGKVGHKINIAVRYIVNSLEALETEIRDDLDMMASEAVSIYYASQVYEGCNLVPGSGRKSSPILATGRVEGDMFVDIALSFSEDQPS